MYFPKKYLTTASRSETKQEINYNEIDHGTEAVLVILFTH